MEACSVNSDINVKKRITKSRKTIKNINRKNRRRKSRLRYYRKLKSLRNKRKTKELCSAIVKIDIGDMEWATVTPTTDTKTTSFKLPYTDVTEWHKLEQISYWKARALSLEYENRMLIHHLRNVYVQQIQDLTKHNEQNSDNKELEITLDVDKTIDNGNKIGLPTFLPREPVGFKRREEMLKLYGNGAEKIMGMETAVQLNYDMHTEETPPFWPQLPLNLKFDD